jgi:hypothetical protein
MLLRRLSSVREARSRNGRRLRAAPAVVGAALIAACGSSPGTPTPSPSPSPSAPPLGGTVSGLYLMQITPAPACLALPRTSLTFPMAASAAGASPHPGVQVLLDPNGWRLEMELLSGAFTLRGGVGTTEEGVLANENLRMWVRAVSAGPVQRAADGRGEIAAGTLAGYLALANTDGFEGSLGTCVATNHAFTLRTR